MRSFREAISLALVTVIAVPHFSSSATAFRTAGIAPTRQQQPQRRQWSLITLKRKDGLSKYHKACSPIAVASKNHRPLWSTTHTSTDASSQHSLLIAAAKRTKLKALSKRVLRKRPIRITLIKSTAFLAGIANVCCFKRHSCYASMMTGNTIKCAKAASQLCLADTLFYASLITSYLLGFVTYRIADQTVTINNNNNNNKEEEEKRPPTTPAIVAPLVLGIFVVYDVLWAAMTKNSGNHGGHQWLICLLAVGSGIINSAAAESTGVVTGMMTGNLQRITNYGVDALLHQLFHRRSSSSSKDGSDTSSNGLYLFPKPSSERQAGFRTSLKILTSFVSGIVLASVGMRRHAALASALVVDGAGGFALLGAAYAILLCLYSFPSAVWKQLSFEKKFQVPLPTPMVAAPTPPCEMDLYETECLVDYENEDAFK